MLALLCRWAETSSTTKERPVILRLVIATATLEQR
jgi:hypothetical protein